MTPAELLRELALIALVMAAWTTLVMLMLERDRKRMERRDAWTADHHTADSSGAGEPGPAASSEEPRGSAAAQEENHAIQPE